jgi:hypothetical protein
MNWKKINQYKYMSTSKKSVLNNIISINPTGTLDFEGTYKMNGPNSIIRDPINDSKNNLIKTQNNQIICNSIEKFENYNSKNNKMIVIFLLFLFLLILIFLI